MKKEGSLQLVSLEQAKKLKELGFDWQVDYYYSIYEDRNILEKGLEKNYNEGRRFAISAPSVALALKWFRDVKKSIATIVRGDNCYFGEVFEDDKTLMTAGRSNKLQTYEEAESALLDALLEYYGERFKPNYY